MQCVICKQSTSDCNCVCWQGQKLVETVSGDLFAALLAMVLVGKRIAYRHRCCRRLGL